MEYVTVSAIGSDKYAFLGGLNSGLNIVRVTNPQSPTFVTSIPADYFGIRDLKVSGTTLYCVDRGSGVRIFNVSNPSMPTQLATVSQSTSVACLDVVANRLFLFPPANNLRVVDVTNPSSPTELGPQAVGDTVTGRIAVVNGLAFITDVYSAADGTDGTKIISVSNPVSMSVRSTIQHIGSPSEVYLKNSIAYLGVDGIGGFHTIDVTNPARPARLGSLRSIGATGIVVSGNTAVTTDYNNGPRTIDASNPGAPTLLATFSQMIGIDVGLLGSNPVIVGRTTGNPALPNLTVLNISNPSSPQSVGSLNLATTAGGANSIAVAGQWGFVGRDSPLTLDVINLATPGAPAKVGPLSLPGLYPHFNAVAATADANYVFAVKNSEGGGIAVVNATTKTAPVLVTTILPGSSIEAVCVQAIGCLPQIISSVTHTTFPRLSLPSNWAITNCPQADLGSML